jgi:hypothetical protein
LRWPEVTSVDAEQLSIFGVKRETNFHCRRCRIVLTFSPTRTNEIREAMAYGSQAVQVNGAILACVLCLTALKYSRDEEVCSVSHRAFLQVDLSCQKPHLGNEAKVMMSWKVGCAKYFYFSRGCWAAICL